MSKSTSKRSEDTRSRSAVLQIPAPFTKASESIDPFLQQLDPAAVYIVHIDRHPPVFKKQIYAIPVILNASIAVLLAWRAYAASPHYLAILQTVLGYVSPATVDLEDTTRGEQLWIVARRTLMFILDFLLFRFVGVWPFSFFFEQPANPVTWRWQIGFRAAEVVVRVSRKWGAEELMKGVKQGKENPFFKTRISPAIERKMMQKTGYLMVDRSWDLEFELMQDAHVLVTQGKVRMEELDKLVLAFEDGVGWLSWRWETTSDLIEDRRRKVVAFKDKLTAMGKESLFWKWTEIVDGERDADGGFTPEKQQMKVKEEFEKAGVDYEDVMKSIGGLGEVTRKAN